MCSAVVVVRRHHRTAKGRSFANAGGATDGSGLVAVALRATAFAHTRRTKARHRCCGGGSGRRCAAAAEHHHRALPPLSYIVATTSQAPVREACFLGFPLDFYFRGKVQHFDGGGIVHTSQNIAVSKRKFLLFFIQYAYAFLPPFWPCRSFVERLMFGPL